VTLHHHFLLLSHGKYIAPGKYPAMFFGTGQLWTGMTQEMKDLMRSLRIL
jgi:hypothetical protein